MRNINKADVSYLKTLETTIETIASGGSASPTDINKIVDKITEILYCTMSPSMANEVLSSLYEVRIILLNILNGNTAITSDVLQGTCAEFNFIEANFIKRYKE